jgi:alcohol dehydrogenase
MIAKALGARVIAIDINDDALAKAADLGANEVLNFDHREDLEVDVAIDALGGTQTCLASIDSLAPRGRHVQIGLMVGEHATPPVPMGTVLGKELRLIGSHGMSARRYPEMLAMIADRRLSPISLVGEQIGLADIPAHIENMGSFSVSAGLTLAVGFSG